MQNEDERLDALKSYEVLDTPDESAFDDLVSLAATFCGTEFSAVSLLDENRIWFKARRGLQFREAEREFSLCAQAIQRPDQVLIISDAAADPRFADNDMVHGYSQIRFYAGVPLVNPVGHPLGTMFVADSVPRSISSVQVEALRALARQAVAQLELRKAKIMLRQQADMVMRTRQEADASGKAKSTFLANISHEIRTPMNGVVGVTALLSATGLSDRQRNYVDIIEKSAEGLLNVLSNIVDYSTNEATARGPELAPIDMPSFVDNIADMMRPIAISKQIRFISSVDEELNRPLAGDVLRLQQVLTNLIGNALKFTSQGTVEVSVGEAGTSVNGLIVRFQVRDTGIGVSRDRQSAIFDEFVQADEGRQRNYEGAGLGLSICRQLATSMGTKIELTSEIGIGSTFWFDLDMPILAQQTKQIELPKAYADEPYQPISRILVAEDNEVNSLVITSMLEQNGCEVVYVDNGIDAIDAVKAQPFDLVFMDVMMPKMDGIRATEAIRSMSGPGRNVPIIAITASVLREDAIKCRMAGMNDFISKPINERIISEALKRWIGQADAVMSA